MRIRPLLTSAYFALRGQPALATWRGFEERQWWDAGRLADHCESLLSQQLNNSARHTPYYRSRGAGSVLADYPVTPRELLAGASGELIADNFMAGPRFSASSSGSSGRVATVLYDDREQLSRMGSSWRGDAFGGQDPWTETVSLWGVSPDAKSPLQQYRRMLAGGLFNSTQLDSLRLDGERVRRYHRIIARLRPKRIIGYVHALRQFAEIAGELGLPAIACDKVIPAAEELDPHSASLIAAFFKGPQMPRYGCREAGDIAHMCEQGSWHVHSDHVKLEVLKEDGSIGETGRGRLLITKLHNALMPLVRYDIGDVASLGGAPCSCGRGLPVMSAVEGRVFSHILLPDGSLLSPFAVTIHMRDVPIRELQIRQEQPGALRLLIVPRPGFDSSHAEWLREKVSEWALGQLSISVEEVGEIPLSAGGKQLLAVNLLSAPLAKQELATGSSNG